jgi:hypothetical protein
MLRLSAGPIHLGWGPYTVHMTVKERIHGLVDQFDEDHALRALVLLEELSKVSILRRPRPAFIGAGQSGYTDLAQKTDELLAEGFGR